MSISPRFLDEIRSRLSLSEIIGKRTRVIRAGREYKACCPFHHEKTPSFTINDDKQFYHCFGCGAHGDVVNFVMRHDNLSFIEAVELLANEAGLQVPKATAREVLKAQKDKDLYSLMEETTRFFQLCLQQKEGIDALSYLQGRGLTDESLESFRVGFSPEDPQFLRRHLLQKGFSDTDMREAGVTKISEKSNEPYSFFRGRIMFPVADRRGRTVAFGGRILPDHLRPPSRGGFIPPKYINSAETPLFHKGSMLYGEPQARLAAADSQRLLIVEGYLDVISCAQAGIRGAMAPMGTALTEEQILSVWKMIPGQQRVPILCFDGDTAGKRAASRACERLLPLLAPGCSVDFVFLPDGEDPDTLIRTQGSEAMQGFLHNCVSLFDFLWASHISRGRFDTPEAQAGLKKVLLEDVSRIVDRDVQNLYKNLIYQRISEYFYAKKLGRHSQKQVQNASGTSSGVKMRKPANQLHHIYPKVLLAGVINHPHIYEDIEEPFGDFDVTSSALNRLRVEIAHYLTSFPLCSREELLQNLKDKGYTQEIDDILSESVYVHASFCSPRCDEGSVLSLWLNYWKEGKSFLARREIKDGWKSALGAQDEEEEERLRNMVWLRTGDNSS